MNFKAIFLLCLVSLSVQQYLSQQTTWEKEQRLYVRDPYCLKWNGQNCLQCPLRYYLQNGKCTPVNPQCNDFDQNTGACLSCYPGYVVNNGLCAVSQNPSVVNYPINYQRQYSQIGYSSPQSTNSNPGCSSFDSNGNCLRCSDRYYLYNNNCTKVSDFCRTWNNNNGDCLTCYVGFELINGGCFGNYNPGQPLAVSLGANSQSDQSLIIPLRQSQQFIQTPQQFVQPQPFSQPQQQYIPISQSIQLPTTSIYQPISTQSNIQPLNSNQVYFNQYTPLEPITLN